MPLLLLAATYLLGSVPFAVVVAQARGVDIRSVGSRNPGAHNVMTQVGRGWGWLVAALDFFKGVLPVLMGRLLNYDEGWQLALGSAAMLGHITSPFLGGRGGKGQSTGFGMLIALYPIGSIVGIVLGLSVLRLTRVVVLSALVAASIIFVIALLQAQAAAIVISPFVVIGLGLLATLPDALALMRRHGGVGSALKAWRGGKEHDNDEAPP
jgi:glycerol-3-phosphate acyltransferase PlsY